MNLLDFWNSIDVELRNNIVRGVLAAVALLLVWLLRRVLATLVVAPLRRLAKRTNTTWDDILLDAIIIPARLIIMALGLALGAQILQVDIQTSLFVQHFIRTLLIIALFMAAFRAINILAPSSNRLFRLTGLTVNERLLPFVRTAAKLILAALALVIIIQEWGYDVSGLVAGLGLGGLAFSLAAQDTVENIFGFTTIVGDQPLMVGEYIKTTDVEGTVEHVGLRSTRIRQPDQAYVTVPNSKLASAPVLNWSRLSKRWYNTTLRVTYDARHNDLTTLMEQIRTILQERELVDSSSIIVNLVNFGDYGYEILVRCYINLADWRAFTEEKEVIHLKIIEVFEELGLKIAVPIPRLP
ncbi:MAG: mechanosensitive ion channel [Anaerolineae bacterium]